jgi:hypothetical protein
VKRWYLLILFFSGLQSSAFGQTICPKERTECTSHCRRYADENNNDSCDLSEAYIKTLGLASAVQVASNVTEKIEEEVTVPKMIVKKEIQLPKNKEKDSIKDKPNSSIIVKKQKPVLAIQIPAQVELPDTTQVLPVKKEVVTQNVNGSKKNNNSPYHLFPVSILIGLAYIISMILSKVKWIRKASHRKFWNIVLLVSFLITGLLGLFLVVQINYDLPIKNLTPYYVLHVDVGIVMAIISVIHFYWHLKYYLSVFKK